MKSRSLRRPIDIFDKFFYLLVIISILLIFFDSFYKLSIAARQLLNYYFILIYVLFAAELIIRLWRSPSKKSYIKNNWIEFVIVLFPFLRILRLAPLLEETLIIGVDRIMRKFHHPRHVIVVNTIIFLVIAIIIMSELILSLEKPYAQSSIKTFPDALWWSTVGVFTTGLADKVPVSTFGRLLTLFLVLLGVISLSLVTANIAALFAEQDIKKDLDREFNEIEVDMNKVEKDIQKEVRQDDEIVEGKIAALEQKISKFKEKKT